MKNLLRFGLRDLLWAVVVVGLAVGWWSDRTSYESQDRNILKVFQRDYHQRTGLQVYWDDFGVYAKHPDGTVERLARKPRF